ncbi:MAG: carboxy terminal-processing peptidase, partial [Planctomycetota bacterium]
SMTGLFIDRGPVVQVKGYDNQVEVLDDRNRGTEWDGPLAVVTSKFSASASEILAGAIQDYERGIIIGDPMTHGKGTVQTLQDLGRQWMGNLGGSNYGALKLTIQQFYLPDGESTQLNGVSADVVLPSMTQHFDVAESDLDYALRNDTIPRKPHYDYELVSSDVLATLRSRSMKRVANEDEFKELLGRVEKYKEQKDAQTLSINETEFFERRKELDAQKEEEDKAIELQKAKKEVFRDYFYNREILNVTHDYLELLRQQNLAANSQPRR